MCPVSFNTVELEYQTQSENGIGEITKHQTFSYIEFAQDPINTGVNVYRVDRAFIKSATYPTVENATITPTNLQPNLTNMELKISKVGIAGDSITFAGVTYPVTNGTITVGSSKHNVDGLVLRSITSDGVTWNNYIDNRQVDDSAAISPVGLGGTWSAIYTLSNLELRTETAPEWIPGGFGIDQDTFALIGLMTCAALTVILGMYGVRSGVKVLWLMMATGGAALIFMFML